MNLFFAAMDRFYDDLERDELRAQDREENARYRSSHWCTVCLGRTGPGSPCHVPQEEEDEENSDA